MTCNVTRQGRVGRFVWWSVAGILTLLAMVAIPLGDPLYDISRFMRQINAATAPFQSVAVKVMTPRASASYTRSLKEQEASSRFAELHLGNVGVKTIGESGVRVQGVTPRVVVIVRLRSEPATVYVRFVGISSSPGEIQVDVDGAAQPLRFVPLSWWLGRYADNGMLPDLTVREGAATYGRPGFSSAVEPDPGDQVLAQFASFVPVPEYQIHVFESGEWKGSVAVWEEAPSGPRLRLFSADGVLERAVVPKAVRAPPGQ